MKSLLVYCALILAPLCSTTEDFMTDEFINKINENQIDWKAERHFPEDTPFTKLRHLTGFSQYSRKSVSSLSGLSPDDDPNIPETFDARTDQWPFCKDIISTIRNQGFCTSSWAFSTAEIMSDRTCIQSKGNVTFAYSPEDFVSCCKDCGGCEGISLINNAWDFALHSGVVSGGDCNSTQGCMPYSNSCFDGTAPVCKTVCQSSYSEEYLKDKMYVSGYNSVWGVNSIQREIMHYGPVQAIFRVYGDFLHYKSGVYYHVDGPEIGQHVVKILGWGDQGGKRYWLAANS